MLVFDDVLPIVFPVVPPMFTGTVLVKGTLIPVKAAVLTPVSVMPCIVLPCMECAGVVALVVLILIPVKGTVEPLKVNPVIVLLLMVEPPVVVPLSQMALTATGLAVVIG